MTATKTEFVERAIQSLKNIIYGYIKSHGENFIHMLPQSVSTMYSRIKRTIGKSPRDVNNTDIHLLLYNESLTMYQKVTFNVGDRVRASKKDTPFRKGYTP